MIDLEQGTLERIKSFNIQCMSRTQVNWTVEQLPKLLEHVDSQASQIVALKEIVIAERAKIIFHDQMMPMMGIHNWDTAPDDDFEIKVGNCMLPVKGRKYWVSEARKQLEAEYEAMR